MNELIRASVDQALANFIDPYLQQSLTAARCIKQITIDNDGRVAIQIALGYAAQGWHAALRRDLGTVLGAIAGVTAVDITIATEIVAHAVQKTLKPLPGVKNIVAVASGKGGVGKSTTTANVALALAAEGARVGILDADIYGPSQPTMLGLAGQPVSPDGKMLEPKIAYDVQVMSIGFLIDEDTPMIWRGPMVTGALQQLLMQTRWDNIDYLVIDLPPGTGDIQLTLAQQIPVSGALIVTTPQDIALLDAQKGVAMFEKVGVPVLGLVENMSIHVCSNCGHAEPIFGEGGGEKLAQKYGVDVLGRLPLDRAIRENADQGHPTVVAEPDSDAATRYREIARKLSAKLALRGKDYSARFPTIVIQNT